MDNSFRTRWESSQRWYEVILTQDLLGDWIVLRAWGGKDSHRHGQKTDLVSSEVEGRNLIEQIHKTRIHRKPAYERVL